MGKIGVVQFVIEVVYFFFGGGGIGFDYSNLKKINKKYYLTFMIIF